MNNPPSSKPELGSVDLDAMREGVNYLFPVSCRKFTFLSRPLSVSERTRVMAEVRGRIKELGGELTTFEEASLIAQYTLSASSKDPSKPAEMTKVTEWILNQATPEELQFMWKQYNTIVEKCDPALELLPEEKVTELVEEVKKKPKLGSALIELSFSDLVSICHRLLTTSETSPEGN